MENMQLKKLNEACSQKILSNKETIQGLEKKITSLREKDIVLGSRKRKRDLCNIKNTRIGSGGLKKQIRALRSLLHSKSNSADCNAGVHYSRLVPKEVVEEMITQKKFMGYRALFKALAKKSQNKLQRGSLLPKPSHVKAARWHVNDEVFEKLGSPFHIKAMFLDKGGKKIQFNEHNNLFFDLEALKSYAVCFFGISQKECDGVLKFVLKLDECEVDKKNFEILDWIFSQTQIPSIISKQRNKVVLSVEGFGDYTVEWHMAGSSSSTRSPPVSPLVDPSSPPSPKSPPPPRKETEQETTSAPQELPVEQETLPFINQPEKPTPLFPKITIIELPREKRKIKTPELKKTPEAMEQNIFSAQTSIPFVLEHLDEPMPSPRSSSSDKSYDIIELESGDLELHEVQKIS
ncbi:hypothetical protein L7F22_021466 [Adiantum nelumboides]|nr:hypothetical protein [Adiantum nelumboides]